MSRVLVIDDEETLAEALVQLLKSFGHDSKYVTSIAEARCFFLNQIPEIVFCDVHMPEKNGLQFFQECKDNFKILPTWIFISGDGSPDLMAKAVQLGAVDVLQKPFQRSGIELIFQRIKGSQNNPIVEIMKIVQTIAGIQLPLDKKILAETRILRRARALNIQTLEKYYEYFTINRASEVREIISVLTTHTTDFFREPDHFDFLVDHHFSDFFKTKKELSVWSAACSTGEEMYSLAMAVLEYIETNGLKSRVEKLKFLGTDIDFNSIKIASEGVYENKKLHNLNHRLRRKFFENGKNEISHLARIIDEIHKLCHFEQLNLQAKNYPMQKFDIIFLRNVLIYFRPQDSRDIVSRIAQHLNPNGLLFLGHSESISGMDTPLELVGNSVYSLKKQVTKIGSRELKSTIRVIVVDDSKTIRNMLKQILSAQFGFEVVGEAEDGVEAAKIAATVTADVMTLDIHMPKMDGITYLESMRGKPHPPVVVISSISYEDAVGALHCLELGAIDYISKPEGMNILIEAERIRAVVRQTSTVKRKAVQELKSNPAAVRSLINSNRKRATNELIAIGASTGGTTALKYLLAELPSNSPPIVIVQHIPSAFSKAFAERLNQVCSIKVKEAAHGDILDVGTAYVAPGGKQMHIIEIERSLVLQITDNPPVNRHKPSVDFLFDSLVPHAKRWRIVAALLTGMGADGAQGLLRLKELGVHTIAQNEESCVVFGMPKEAVQRGAAIEVLPLSSIAYHLMKALDRKQQISA